MMTLQEALNLMGDSGTNFSALIDNSDFWDFVNEIDKYGAEILRDKDPDYLLGMIHFLEATSLSVCLTQGKMSLETSLRIAGNREMALFVAMLVKLTIGLSALEELR